MKPSSLPFHHVVKGDFRNYKKLAHQLDQGHFDGLRSKSRKKNRAPFPWSEEQRAWMKGHVDPYLELDLKKHDMWSKQKVEDLVNKWRFANAGDTHQCFIKYLQNALARSRTSQKQPPIIKFPRKHAENAADLWAKAPENKILLDTAVAEKHGDALTKNNVGIRSTLKAAMFKALSSKEQEQWEKKASELKEVSAEDKVKSIWENQEIMADTLVATLEGSIGMGKNQVGDATYHVQMAYLDKEGNVQSTSICCGIMLDDKAFKDVEPETYTSLSKAWIKYATEALFQNDLHVHPNNEFAITLAKDSTRNPILPQYDDSWVRSHCAEVLGHYLEGVWKSTGSTEVIPWSSLQEDPSHWIIDPAAVPKTPIDDPCVIKGTTIFKLYDELYDLQERCIPIRFRNQELMPPPSTTSTPEVAASSPTRPSTPKVLPPTQCSQRESTPNQPSTLTSSTSTQPSTLKPSATTLSSTPKSLTPTLSSTLKASTPNPPSTPKTLTPNPPSTPKLSTLTQPSTLKVSTHTQPSTSTASTSLVPSTPKAATQPPPFTLEALTPLAPSPEAPPLPPSPNASTTPPPNSTLNQPTSTPEMPEHPLKGWGVRKQATVTTKGKKKQAVNLGLGQEDPPPSRKRKTTDNQTMESAPPVKKSHRLLHASYVHPRSLWHTSNMCLDRPEKVQMTGRW
ncbi:uncharacterized protein LACBIDRAFT_308446 [Laccaria bicolor S238N-H82]|uniref:Predicted protein n=1 Tax=Laccaria bicolor (strain S238N-H82 / ATCC MYA-4686) TaxID=486041 RepID=B0CWA8_LACBS|nr:uncharacterized protein LACBIDRAFT_308446 [Laccaria bicolor S238N-H82]EDR13034.1 predicted protein [Laccaria bicolor S238N-H82]|eukprot:XP_001875532.1 predicted protein [Laccaria bicolor S238N-H82]